MKPVFASGSSKRPTMPSCTERVGVGRGEMIAIIRREGILDPSMNGGNEHHGGILDLACDQGAEITLMTPALGFSDAWMKAFPPAAWSGGIYFSLQYNGVSGPSAPPKNQDCRYFFDPIRPGLGFVNQSSSNCDIADGNIFRIGTESNDITTRKINVTIRTLADTLRLRTDDDPYLDFDDNPNSPNYFPRSYEIKTLYSVLGESGSLGAVDIRLDPRANVCGNPKAFELVYPEPVKFKQIGAGANRIVNETERFYIGVKYNRRVQSGTCNRKIEPKVTFSLGTGEGELLDDNIHIDLKEVGLLLSLKTASNGESTSNKDVVFGQPVSLRSISVEQHRRTVFTAFDAKLTRNPQRELKPGSFNQVVSAEIEYD